MGLMPESNSKWGNLLELPVLQEQLLRGSVGGAKFKTTERDSRNREASVILPQAFVGAALFGTRATSAPLGIPVEEANAQCHAVHSLHADGGTTM